MGPFTTLFSFSDQMKITTQNSIQNYQLPRELPFGIRFMILCANVPFLIGFVFTFIGLATCIPFTSMMDLNFSNPLDKDPSIGKAVITSISNTNASENDVAIIRYNYSYSVNGKNYSSSSFTKGERAIFVNDTVPIQFDKNNPSFSRIQNMRMAEFDGTWLLFIFIFPFVGIVFLVISLIKGRKNISLVKNGFLTKGSVTNKEATNVRINNRTVYKVYFDYTANDGVQRRAFTRTHQPEKVEDEEKEQLLFNANNPEEAVLLDTLPRQVRKFFERLN